MYAYSFAAERERRLPGSTSADEYWPTIWGSRLAFVRSDPKQREGPAPYWTSLVGAGRAQRLPVTSPGFGARDRAEAAELDMRRRSVVYTWGVRLKGANRSFIRLASIDGRLRPIGAGTAAVEGGTAPRQFVGNPGLASTGVIWEFADATKSRVRAHLIRQGMTPHGCPTTDAQGSKPLNASATAQTATPRTS